MANMLIDQTAYNELMNKSKAYDALQKQNDELMNMFCKSARFLHSMTSHFHGSLPSEARELIKSWKQYRKDAKEKQLAIAAKEVDTLNKQCDKINDLEGMPSETLQKKLNDKNRYFESILNSNELCTDLY